MLFREFAEYLQRLEKISSRLEITDLLAELIEKLDVDEVANGVYLTQGLLGPTYDNREFNMAGKMVIRAVATAFKKDNSEVEKKYKDLGDMGEVVTSFGVDSDRKSNSLNEVFEALKVIAYFEGTGSQELKVNKLSELISEISTLEGKFVVRMVMGKLRLGFSEKTVFDALSKIESGSKSLRKELDKVYQLYPDSGEIVKEFKRNGVDGLKNIVVMVGVPVVPSLCQRLNTYEEIVKNMGEVAIEPKYDGTRVQIHYKKLETEKNQNNVLIKSYTRNLEESSAMFPELKKLSEYIKAEEIVLDCEAVGFDPVSGRVLNFQETITRKRKHGVEEAAASVPLRFFCFDVLYCDGKSLLNLPYFERRKILSEQVKTNSVLVVDESIRTTDPVELEEIHTRFLDEGYEGAVMKKWDGDYLPGRQGWNWVKIKEAQGSSGKLADTFDLAVLGYYAGKGKRSGFGIGAFLVGTKKGEQWVSLAKIGTGLTDEEFVEIRKRLDEIKLSQKPENTLVEDQLTPDVWVEPKLLVEIAADELTKSPLHSGGVALRFPRLVRLRGDKGIDGITTWSEVVEIGKLSGNVF